ncbi:phenoloxidase-activating factor 1-like [Musca autumnalis]|uniref:phenoloxidase-activating factor 1-like n=1 Tax=Musca autumnalis TaxID=221902 RepID=UPI003CF607AA
MKYNFIILLIITGCSNISANTITITGVSNLCHNPYGRLGRCLSLEKCLRLKSGGGDNDIINWHCSYGRGLPPYVCCTFGNSIVFPDDDDDGYRRIPFVAPSFVRSFEKPNEDKISRSSANIFSPNENDNSENKKNATEMLTMLVNDTTKDLFPKPGVCGPLTVGDKIHGGWEAELGEFPWLVNLEYRTADDFLTIGCAGSILTNRYILTAGHCVRGEIETIGVLESIRAGDHNLETEKDCDADDYCIDPFQRILVEKTWVHEDFFVTKRRKIYNDVALVKTQKDIIYSNSVAPVCLPLVMPGLPPPKNGTRLTVAGWGGSESANYTDEKRIVDVICLDDEKCKIRNESSRLCVGGEKGKDSCRGDSGGSLARRTKDGWLLEGIVSYGVGCGNGKPAIYTRVRTFINWISDQIRGA